MGHTISIEDCKLQPITHSMALSSGKGSDKRLDALIDVEAGRVTYRVTDHGEAKYEGPWIHEAVTAYNAAP